MRPLQRARPTCTLKILTVTTLFLLLYSHLPLSLQDTVQSPGGSVLTAALATTFLPPPHAPLTPPRSRIPVIGRPGVIERCRMDVPGPVHCISQSCYLLPGSFHSGGEGWVGVGVEGGCCALPATETSAPLGVWWWWLGGGWVGLWKLMSPVSSPLSGDFGSKRRRRSFVLHNSGALKRLSA